MTEVHAYRASDELAAALRAFGETEREFGKRITEYDTAHPGHELLWVAGGFSMDKRAVGFRDSDDEVPEGLSRAKSRPELRPKKSKAGREWQEVLNWANDRPKVEPVFQRFGVTPSSDGGPAGNGLSRRICPTQWGDAATDGVLVYTQGDLRHPFFGGPDDAKEISEHLTPIPLSEFYAIKERLDAEREPAAAGS